MPLSLGYVGGYLLRVRRMAFVLEQFDVFSLIEKYLSSDPRSLAALVLSEKRLGWTDWTFETEELQLGHGEPILVIPTGSAALNSERIVKYRLAYLEQIRLNESIASEMEVIELINDSLPPASPAWSSDSNGHLRTSRRTLAQ